jgi:hypothetical protein
MPIANTNVYRRRDDGTTEIITRLGDVFLIDWEDEPIAKRHCWSLHEHGYARAVTRLSSGKLKTVYLHRLICETSPDRPHVDHISGDQSDCRRRNLRPCTRHENLRNQRRRADNATGFKGVGFHKQTGKFRARARAGASILGGGLFDTPQEAAAVAMQRRTQLHGEFARHE